MNRVDPNLNPTSITAEIQRRHTVRSFILSGAFLPYVVLSSIGMAVLVVVGSIAINAIKNHGLIPPPNTLDRYECNGVKGPFTFYYLHGTERVKIKSIEGILEGTVYNNQFDWASFSNDSTQLGFLPPSAISFEDATTLRIKGPGPVEVDCPIVTKHVGERREIVR